MTKKIDNSKNIISNYTGDLYKKITEEGLSFSEAFDNLSTKYGYANSSQITNTRNRQAPTSKYVRSSQPVNPRLRTTDPNFDTLNGTTSYKGRENELVEMGLNPHQMGLKEARYNIDVSSRDGGYIDTSPLDYAGYSTNPIVRYQQLQARLPVRTNAGNRTNPNRVVYTGTLPGVEVVTKAPRIRRTLIKKPAPNKPQVIQVEPINANSPQLIVESPQIGVPDVTPIYTPTQQAYSNCDIDLGTMNQGMLETIVRDYYQNDLSPDQLFTDARGFTIRTGDVLGRLLDTEQGRKWANKYNKGRGLIRRVN